MIRGYLTIILLTLLLSLTNSQCYHPVFCSLGILQAAADSNLFKDSKTFVDLTLKFPTDQVLKNFKNQKPADFFQQNFHMDPEILLSGVTFPDYQQNPETLSKIQDPELRNFAIQLNKRWNQLGKKVNLSAAGTIGTCKTDCSSFLPELDNLTMLVPGGRFRESYYWDTYWIILGLIASDMLNTAQSIINNFASIISKYGFIPNGFRQYYLTRSQPPFFFMMIKDLVQAFNDKGDTIRASNLQKRMFDILNIEHNYWQTTHVVATYIKGQFFTLNQYRSNTKSPRPESYRQDVETTSKIVDPSQRARIWAGISSIAESGWDFSSRWLRNSSLTTTDIDLMIPSDLNALLGIMQKYLVELSEKYNRKDLVDKYTKRYGERIKYFQTIKKNGRFPDFQFDQTPFMPDIVYPTDFLPYLFLEQKISLISTYNRLVNPQASFIRTGQQWDAPNVFAPNNWIIHKISLQEQAKKYATQWVSTTYCSYVKYNSLFEKYRASMYGQRGEGGQYEPQVGFGWTNGLALHYLRKYPNIQHPRC